MYIGTLTQSSLSYAIKPVNFKTGSFHLYSILSLQMSGYNVYPHVDYLLEENILKSDVLI